MKLIKLEVNNFRQFYGKQVIDFSADPLKNVTLIHGENNGGKTALLNALRWCLYEETTENLLDSHDLLNKHALAQGEGTFSVFIQLIHDNRLLEVRRFKSRNNSTSSLKIFEIIEGCYSEKSESNPNTLINTFLPKEMSQYFFYQGEGTGTLNSQNDFSHIKSAISKVLGLTVAEKTLTHLNTIKNDYQKDLKEYDRNNEIDILLDSKERIQAELSRCQISLSNKQESFSLADKEFEKQLELSKKFDKTSIDDKIKLRTKQESLLAITKQQKLNLLNEKRKSLPSWLYDSYSESLSRFNISDINTDELKMSSRYTVDKKLIKSILEHNECICGTRLEEHTKALEIISELEKSAVDTEQRARWNRVVELKRKLESLSSPLKPMMENLSQIDDCDTHIHVLENQLLDLSQSISESDIDDIKLIEKNRNEAKNQRDVLARELPLLEQKISKLKKDLTDIDLKVSRLSASEPKAKKVKNLIKAVDKIIHLFNSSINLSKEGVDSILLTEMQNFFKRVAFNGYTVKKVNTSVSGSFVWSIVDKDGKKVSAGNGYQAMLSISFIVALIQFSKLRSNSKQHLLTPGTVAPFIADSILAFIGPDNGRELVRYIAESVEQSIFMFSQAQWTESHSDIGIRDKIGKEYNLIQHTVLTEQEFKGQYPTQLSVNGNKFDVVRFGSDFDKVTIEEISING